MVGRGAAWVSGLSLGILFVACGGKVDSDDGSAGEGGESGLGGDAGTGTVTGGRMGSLGGSSASMNGGSGRMGVGGAQGGAPATGGRGPGPSGGTTQGGAMQGGASGTGGACRPSGSQGGGFSEEGCPVPWWGTSLDGVKGVLTCPEPYDPAMLAYGQTNLSPCVELSGPVAQGISSEGGISCCYHLDERGCCDSTFEGDFCIDVPYFGDGTRVTTLPEEAIDDPFGACDTAAGQVVELTTRQAADRMIGVWLTCGGMPEPYLGQGFIFRADGSFHAITLNEDLTLAESEGCLQGGLWGFLASTGQLNLHIEDYSQFVFPVFTAGPGERLVLENQTFVRVSAPAGK